MKTMFKVLTVALAVGVIVALVLRFSGFGGGLLLSALIALLIATAITAGVLRAILPRPTRSKEKG